VFITTTASAISVATYALLPSGLMAIPFARNTGIFFETVLVAVLITVIVSAHASVTYNLLPCGVFLFLRMNAEHRNIR